MIEKKKSSEPEFLAEEPSLGLVLTEMYAYFCTSIHLTSGSAGTDGSCPSLSKVFQSRCSGQSTEVGRQKTASKSHQNKQPGNAVEASSNLKSAFQIYIRKIPGASLASDSQIQLLLYNFFCLSLAASGPHYEI